MANYKPAIEKLHEDVGSNNFRIYETDQFPTGVIPNTLMNKCSQVAVACSSSPEDGRDWLIIFPYRVDSQGAKKVYDYDPYVTVVDCSSVSPAESGCFRYHGTWDGRTSPIEGYEQCSVEMAVSDLREQIQTTSVPLNEAPAEILSALPVMARTYIKLFEEQA